MSIFVTNKNIENDNYIIVTCGYGKANYITYFEKQVFHNCGDSGWNWSGYILKSSREAKQVLLITGYRNLPKSYKKIDFRTIINDYEKHAYEIVKNYDNETLWTAIQNNNDNLIDEIWFKAFE